MSTPDRVFISGHSPKTSIKNQTNFFCFNHDDANIPYASNPQTNTTNTNIQKKQQQCISNIIADKVGEGIYYYYQW